MPNFTAARASPASSDGSVRAEPLQGDKWRVEALIGHQSDPRPAMNRTSLRAEPISIHLARHRDCLERCRSERPTTAASDGDNVSDLSPFAMLPFDRQDDDE
jgi:hypothetical protein